MPEKPEKAKPINFNSPKRNDNRAHYNSKHRRLRLQRLAIFPICEICQKEFSSIAHHLVYPANDVNSYQALCSACHKKIHS